MEDFKENDKVITSKGRFGTIETIKDKSAIVIMGNKKHEIYLKELLHVSKSIGIEIEYYKDYVNAYDDPCKDLIYVSNKLVLYDFNNPMDNKFIEECKLKLIKRIGYKNVVITKITLA